MINIHSILSYLGLILEINGILSLIPVIISGIYHENVYPLFLITALISFISGTFLDRKFKKEELDIGSSMIISTLSFVIISLLGAIPFLSVLDPLDAVFESVSGFTTTGLTVVIPENLSHSLLFWRSFTQWIGGIGILLIFILLVGSPGISSYYLYRAEGKIEKIEASVYGTVKKIFIIYGAYTVIGILLLVCVGMPLFDSVLISFSSVSTGGFSPKTGSIGGYKNPLIEVVVMVLMTLGATSFFLHHKIWKGDFRSYLKNSETRFFWTLIIVFSIFLSFLFGISGIKNGIFYTFSALTTSGFSLSGRITGTSEFLIILLMIIGGYAGSSAGGIKLVRAGILWKSFGWIAKKISLPPEAVVSLRYQERTIHDSETSVITLFVCLYMGILFISATVLTFIGYSPLDSLFQAASAQGTVGLSVIDIHSMPPLGKFILILNMLLGRLEIFPFLVLFYSIYRGAMRKIE